MNLRKFIVFDFETDGLNPEVCNPVQLAALVIEPRTLSTKEHKIFHTWMKPPGIDDLDTYLTDDRKETIEFHMRNYNCSQEEVLDKWKKAPLTKHCWQNFATFVNQFNVKGKDWDAPIPCGANIRDFDLKIAARLNKEYKIKPFFFKRNAIDTLDQCFAWWENLDGVPESYAMDRIRPYFGIDTKGGHDAVKDVRDTAAIIIRFMRLNRRYAPNVNFKNSFKRTPIDV